MANTKVLHRFALTVLFALGLVLALWMPDAAQGAQEPLEITDLQVSNQLGNAFVVSWRTSRPTFNNVLLYGKNSLNLDRVMGDSTISSGKSSVIHYVQLVYLDINTTYFFKVRSDGVEYSVSPMGVDSVVTFSQKLPPAAILFYGQVVNSSTHDPLERVLARSYLKTIRPGVGGTTVVDSSTWYSLLTDVQGIFQYDRANYRDFNGSVFVYRPGLTWIHLELLGTSQGTVTDSVLLTATESTLLQDLGVFLLVDEREALNGRVRATGPVLANGRSASVVRVTVLDKTKKPVSNVEVRLRAAVGYEQGVTFHQPTTPTDVNGMTWGLVHSTVSETKIIQALNVSRPDSAALDSTAMINFVTPPGDITQDKTPPFIYFTTEYADTNDNLGPYNITASVVDNFTPVVRMAWSVSGNVYKDTVLMMAQAGTDDFRYGIPGQAYNSVVNYFVMASDSAGFRVSSPDSFISNPFLLPYRFEVLPPGGSPEAKMGITHTTELSNTTNTTRPRRVETWVTAHSGVRTAVIKWRNAKESETFFDVVMEHYGSHYWGSIPAKPVGSRIEYFIQVTDSLGRVDADRRRAPLSDLYSYEVLAAGPRSEASYVDTTMYLGTTDAHRSEQAAVGDLNGDRYPDVVTANYGEPNSVYFYNQYDGALHEVTSQAISIQPSDKSNSVAAIDVDADDDLDLVFGNDGQQSRLYINNGKGAFDDVTTRTVAEGVTRMPAEAWHTVMVLADDFNGDGAIDLYMVNNTPGGEVNRLLFNDSLGVFRDVTNLYILNSQADQSVWACAGDIDGDKDIDIVVINRAQNHAILTNKGKGIFQRSEITAASAAQAHGGELVDVDGDGDLDLVVAQSNTQQNELFLNNGRGVFTRDTQRLPAESDNTYGVRSFDANMDGYPDLYYVNYSQANRLLLNDGTGYFSEAPAGMMPTWIGVSTSVGLTDFNQDSRPDLYITQEDRRNTLVFSRARLINPSDLPSRFDLITPTRSDTVSATQVTFIWHRSYSEDSTDVVRYGFDLSLDSLFSASKIVNQYTTLSDTTLTLSDLPDNTRFWWRVYAQNSTLTPVYSNSTFSFVVNTSFLGGTPEFAVLLSRNPVLTGYMNIYIVSSVPLAAAPQLTVNLSALGVTRIGQNDIWRGQYFARSGFLLSVTGTSLGGRPGEFVQTYPSMLASVGAMQSASLPSWIEPAGTGSVEVLVAHNLPPSGSALKHKLESLSLQGLGAGDESLSCESYTFIPLGESTAGGYKVFFRATDGFRSGLAICRLDESGGWQALATSYDQSRRLYTATSATIGTFALLSGMGPSAAGLPRAFSLGQNVPNPFNPSTTISYRVPEEMGTAQVELKVYNLRGALVRTLIDRAHTPGVYSVEWNGCDEGGRELPSGIYFYRLKAGSIAINRKMVLIR
ncbi:FG-GAP-like repeat-containing protein [bacterium]|nr:FG-GAP-like repeat-containing protein [bacterium]